MKKGCPGLASNRAQTQSKLPNVPTVFELMEQYKVTEPKRRFVETYLGIWGFGSRPIVTSPGVPADRVKIFRDAFCEDVQGPGIYR